MHIESLKQFINEYWDNQIVPALVEYIKIPNKSPAFDPDWKQNGYMDQVVKLVREWIEQNKPSNSSLHIFEENGRTPLIILEIPGKADGTVLMYGHLDKQPEMAGWADGLGPWTPVLKNDKLYGRGSADDGYAVFASLCAINSLIEQNVTLPRIVVLIECSEESGSPDLSFYMDYCKDLIGKPDLVICLDSGAGNYEQFWTTTSLRGLIGCTLRVDILKEGVHSGSASGIVPSSFRIIRQLLSRLEDEKSGSVLPQELYVEIPTHRIQEAKAMVEVLGDGIFTKMPWMESAVPVADDTLELVLNNTWKPMLSIVGVEGIPPLKSGGNVLRPYTSLKLSLRIPPIKDAADAQNSLAKLLTENPPYGAKVTLHFEEPATGWNAPELKPWLKNAINDASNEIFGEPDLSMGEGGTIPFMSMLGKKFPNAQFLITGVLGPQANAHGPNEFLHIPYGKKLTACISLIIQSFSAQTS